MNQFLYNIYKSSTISNNNTNNVIKPTQTPNNMVPKNEISKPIIKKAIIKKDLYVDPCAKATNPGACKTKRKRRKQWEQNEKRRLLQPVTHRTH
jgi:hypothetical protein